MLLTPPLKVFFWGGFCRDQPKNERKVYVNKTRIKIEIFVFTVSKQKRSV